MALFSRRFWSFCNVGTSWKVSSVCNGKLSTLILKNENWILQEPAPIAKWFIKREKIYFDLITVYTQEHTNLSVCFKCCGFDRVAKYFQETYYKCVEQHSAKGYEVTEYKCVNCQKIKLSNLNHSARDCECSVYKRRFTRFRNTIKNSESIL